VVSTVSLLFLAAVRRSSAPLLYRCRVDRGRRGGICGLSYLETLGCRTVVIAGGPRRVPQCSEACCSACMTSAHIRRAATSPLRSPYRARNRRKRIISKTPAGERSATPSASSYRRGAPVSHLAHASVSVGSPGRTAARRGVPCWSSAHSCRELLHLRLRASFRRGPLVLPLMVFAMTTNGATPKNVLRRRSEHSPGADRTGLYRAREYRQSSRKSLLRSPCATTGRSPTGRGHGRESRKLGQCTDVDPQDSVDAVWRY